MARNALGGTAYDAGAFMTLALLFRHLRAWLPRERLRRRTYRCRAGRLSRSVAAGLGRSAVCPDCGPVQMFRGRCPFCSSETVTPGGVPKQVARLPFLRLIKAVKREPKLQRSIEAFSRFRRRG